MSLEKPDIEISEKTSLTQTLKNKPFIVAGMTGWVMAVLYGAYHYKKYGTKTKLSLYLIQLRVGAQGIVVGACTLGVLYSLYRDYVKKPNEEKQ